MLWAGFFTFPAFDTLFLIDMGSAVHHADGAPGAYLHTGMFQTALTALRHHDTLLRTGVAGKFYHVDQRRLIVLLLDHALLHSLRDGRMFRYFP